MLSLDSSPSDDEISTSETPDVDPSEEDPDDVGDLEDAAECLCLVGGGVSTSGISADNSGLALDEARLISRCRNLALS